MEQQAVNSRMITLARESRGYTQTKLAELIAVSQGKMSKIEQGLLTVSEPVLEELSEVLNYKKSFFFEPDHIYPPATPFHRKKSSLSKSLQAMIESKANIQRIHFSKLQKSTEFDTNIKYLDLDDYGGSTANIAIAMRRYWKIPKGPIENMVELLEDAGIAIMPIDFGTDAVDGFTLITPRSLPIIFINKAMSGDRQRFTLAHELGHIVMHQVPSPDVENEANGFASEFLMPSDEIKSSLRNLDISKAAALKPYWKVSMGALIFRAANLNTITPNQSRYLWVKMAKNGYKKREPVRLDIEVEKPTLLNELVDLHVEQLGYSFAELSQLLHLNLDECRALYGAPKGRLHAVK